MTKNLETIRASARKIWSSDEGQLAFCLALIDLAIADTTHISFSRLLDIGKKYGVSDPKAVFRVADYLTGDEANVLEAKFEFIDDEDEPWLETFTLQDVLTARRTKTFANPRSGANVDEFEEHLFLFFAPSMLAKELGAGKS